MKTVIGLFDDFSAAQAAVEALVARNFNRDDISIAANNSGNAGGADGLNSAASADRDGAQDGDRKHAMQEGAKSGAGAGAVVGTGIGGTVGLLAGLGIILIPGIGPIIAAGPLVATLTGAGIGAAAGAAVGGLVGALTRVGVPEHDAHFYAESVRRGGTLVMVRASDDLAYDAADVLSELGAVDVDERRSHFEKQGFAAHDAGSPAYTSEQIASERETYRASQNQQGQQRQQVQQNTGPKRVEQTVATVPVIEETLTVGKRRVERGGIRMYTEVTETPVHEQVTLREQTATVERKAVDRPVAVTESQAFKEQTFEVREFAEHAVVAKKARVVEEVTIRKDVADRTETIDDSVRRTDVAVEKVATAAIETATTISKTTATPPPPPPPRTAK